MAARATFKSVAGLNKAMRRLPKETVSQLRDASQRIADRIAADARARAQGQSGLAAIVGPTIRAGRDRVPVVRMGGAGKLPDSGDGWERDRDGAHQTIGDAMWGAEFGGRRRPTTQQFLPWRGSGEGAGYFLWPAIREDSDWIDEQYSEALGDALEVVR
jgi:hypothetical protein